MRSLCLLAAIACVSAGTHETALQCASHVRRNNGGAWTLDQCRQLCCGFAFRNPGDYAARSLWNVWVGPASVGMCSWNDYVHDEDDLEVSSVERFIAPLQPLPTIMAAPDCSRTEVDYTRMHNHAADCIRKYAAADHTDWQTDIQCIRGCVEVAREYHFVAGVDDVRNMMLAYADDPSGIEEKCTMYVDRDAASMPVVDNDIIANEADIVIVENTPKPERVVPDVLMTCALKMIGLSPEWRRYCQTYCCDAFEALGGDESTITIDHLVAWITANIPRYTCRYNPKSHYPLSAIVDREAHRSLELSMSPPVPVKTLKADNSWSCPVDLLVAESVDIARHEVLAKCMQYAHNTNGIGNETCMTTCLAVWLGFPGVDDAWYLFAVGDNYYYRECEWTGPTRSEEELDAFLRDLTL